MTDRDGLKDRVIEVFKNGKRSVDYMDIRMGEGESTAIDIRKKRIEDVTRPRSFGGRVRALYKGGWGFAAFTRIDQLPEAVEKAKRFSRLIAGSKSILAEVPVVRDVVLAGDGEKDFLNKSLGHKVNILKYYDKMAWTVGPEVVNVNVSYGDSLTWKLFVSSEGSVIEQEKAMVYSLLQVTARKSGVVGRYHIHLTDTNFAALGNREEEVLTAARVAVKLTRAPQVTSGSYEVILDPLLAGVFAHEAFGHLSEADNVYENPQLAKVMRMGKRFGSPLLTIYDDPSELNFRGSYKYDDEGVAASRAALLDKGVLVGRMHARETAGKMSEKPNGHARAAGARAVPIVRMGITRILPGKSSFEEMLAGVKKGLYCINWQAGNTDHERFTFTAGYAREINNGKLGRVVRDVKLTGNLFETLESVSMVGRETVIQGGSCGKMGQYIPENSAAPQVRISKVEVIGV